jgi:hypothetical protein
MEGINGRRRDGEGAGGENEAQTAVCTEASFSRELAAYPPPDIHSTTGRTGRAGRPMRA